MKSLLFDLPPAFNGQHRLDAIAAVQCQRVMHIYTGTCVIWNYAQFLSNLDGNRTRTQQMAMLLADRLEDKLRVIEDLAVRAVGKWAVAGHRLGSAIGNDNSVRTNACNSYEHR